MAASHTTGVDAVVQFGRHPVPRYRIVHLSDTHLLSGRGRLHGAVDQDALLRTALGQLERSGAPADAIVLTGDLTDLGEPDAYDRLRELVEPLAGRLGAAIVWVPGNHDERPTFARHLLDEPETDAPLDRVHTVGGLRIIALDTTVPGYHHGDLGRDQLDWLAAELERPAEHGTILAVHHPPIPASSALMSLLELRGQDELAALLRGAEVRAILGGHLHYSTHGTFAGVPVHVAGAGCYSIDPAAPAERLRGIDGGQSFAIIDVHDDTVVHSTVPIGDHPVISGFDAEVVAQLALMTPEERLERFSRKPL